MNTSRAISIQEKTQPGEARRAAMEMVQGLAFDEQTASNIALVVTEAATNIVKHGGGGEILLRPLHHESDAGVEILALDSGSGMQNVTRCFEDGYSTGSTPGNGLGAIFRLSTILDVYSAPKLGTVLMAQIWKNRDRSRIPAAAFVSGAVSVAMAGQSACGDAWNLQHDGTTARLLVADGLGHGEMAAEASTAAVRVWLSHPRRSIPAVIADVHSALRSTRGAAVAIAEIDRSSQTVRFAGAGNISGYILAEGAARRNMVSLNGTAGQEIRKILEFQYPWDSGAVLVLQSDGLSTHWSLDTYPGLFRRHPSVIAGVLYRDFKRTRDDSTVIVVREAARPA